MMSGTMNLMNWSKTATKVLTPRTTGAGTTLPRAMPRMMARAMRGKRPNEMRFMGADYTKPHVRLQEPPQARPESKNASAS